MQVRIEPKELGEIIKLGLKHYENLPIGTWISKLVVEKASDGNYYILLVLDSIEAADGES